MRHAIDTNILIRLIVEDDDGQSARLIDLYRFKLFVTFTVILEAEWVLRKSIGLPRDVINALLVAFVELENVTVADLPAVSLHWNIIVKGWILPMPCTGLSAPPAPRC